MALLQLSVWQQSCKTPLFSYWPLEQSEEHPLAMKVRNKSCLVHVKQKLSEEAHASIASSLLAQL